MSRDVGTYGGDPQRILPTLSDTIVFSTYDEDYGIVPEPVPSSETVPDWVDDIDVDDGIRAAIDEGWLIRTPASVQINTDGGISSYDLFHRSTIGTHGLWQVGELSLPIDIVKFMSYWNVRLPDGYSALLTHPINRPNEIFTSFSGCVDFDVFPTFTHAPSVIREKGLFEVQGGTPIFQCIPFKRDDMIRTAVVREATEDELDELETPTEIETELPDTSVDVQQIY